MITEAERITATFKNAGMQILVTDAKLLEHFIEMSENKLSL